MYILQYTHDTPFEKTEMINGIEYGVIDLDYQEEVFQLGYCCNEIGKQIPIFIGGEKIYIPTGIYELSMPNSRDRLTVRQIKVPLVDKIAFTVDVVGT